MEPEEKKEEIGFNKEKELQHDYAFHYWPLQIEYAQVFYFINS